VIKTIVSGEDKLYNASLNLIPDKNCCFELFGFDILIDSNINPWLLEVNLSPSLSCDSALDHKIKTELVAECFNLSRIIPLNLRGREEEYVRQYYNNCGLNEIEVKIRKELCHIEILKEFKISKKIKEIIWETDEENKRRSKFKRLLPSTDYISYRRYYSKENPINLFLSLREIEKERIAFKKVNIINIKQN
jgi:hypothetical protein